MIQDIAPHHFDNAYHPMPPDGDSIALCFDGRSCLMKNTEEGIVFPRFADLEKENTEIYEDYTYLFRIDQERYYLVTEFGRENLAEFEMEDIAVFRQADPQHRAFAGITGHQLYQWYQAHRYCGRCGSPTKPDSKERMLYCEKCHSMEYPKICPAVIIGVTDKTAFSFRNTQDGLIKNMPFLPDIRKSGRQWKRLWRGRFWKRSG